MTSKVKIIRHSFLEEPYDNYENLDYTQLRALAKGEVQPGIHSKSEELAYQLSLHIHDADVILHGPSRRSIETAALINNIAGKKCALYQLDALNEIGFGISHLVGESDYEKDGLQVIRSRLIQKIGEHTHETEDLESIYGRILTLDKTIQNDYQNQNVLMVSHGFFMRYLYSFFVDKVTNIFDLQHEVEKNYMRFDYLTGFEFAK